MLIYFYRWWYTPILPEENAFPDTCRQALTAFVLSVSNRISRTRPTDAFLDFLTNSSLIITVLLNELSAALAASPNVSAAEAIDTYIRTKPESNLTSLLDTKSQQRKLDLVAEDILECFLDPKAYECEPARVFLCQVIAKMMMDPTIRTCSQPEWVNGWIVYLLEDTEPELLSAIDAGIEPAQAVKDVSTAASSVKESSGSNHKRVVSKAQEAMDDALAEAARMNALIAEDDARRAREQEALDRASIDMLQLGSMTPPVRSRRGSEKLSAPPENLVASPDNSTHISDDASEVTTQGIATPASSQSDHRDGPQASPRSIPPESESPKLSSPTGEPEKSGFTSFDQIIPVYQPTALAESPEPVKKEIPPLTLFNATISIFDDSMPGDKNLIRSKPNMDYLVQIEPASQHHSGWMISRKYADFETLHDILRRLSVISGVGFTEAHSVLPNWKGHTKQSLRGELERYLNDAVHWRPLAESEGMKRFFEKDQVGRSQGKGFPGLGWPPQAALETVGKGMIDVLTKAPKEVAGGGKAIFGGVTGVLGGIGQKKVNNSTPNLSRSSTSNASQSSLNPKLDTSVRPLPAARQSQDTLRTPSPVVDTQPQRIPPMERRPSAEPDVVTRPRPTSASMPALPGRASRDSSRASSLRESMQMEPVLESEKILNLPPPPSEITDEYEVTGTTPGLRKLGLNDDSSRLSRASTIATAPASEAPTARSSEEAPSKTASSAVKRPMTEQETQVAVELFFAIISELYTLSSAWSLRRTLLTAAKNFLLRPGNPQLESIRQLLQSSVLESNTSDSGIAFHLRKLRENSLPTTEEFAAWPKPLNEEEKEKLRKKARKLLVEKGMPQALTTVMGAAASGEALGKVFDCLQIELVNRGLMFGLMLQGIRIVTQS